MSTTQAVYFVMRFWIAVGLAPVNSSTFSPSLKTIIVGMARTASSWVRSGTSSMSNLAKRAASLKLSASDHLYHPRR